MGSAGTKCQRAYLMVAECVELIARHAALGIGEIGCLMNFGGPDLAAVERSMRLFAEHVLPCLATG